MASAATRPIVSSRMQLDELIALNDEIAALARAGIPMGRGLLDTSRDLPGRLSRLASQLGASMERGKSLQAAVEENHAIPPVYGSILEAGMDCGGLSKVLERTSTSLRRIAELRRVVIAALSYPLLVLILSVLLFVFFTRDAYRTLLALVQSNEVQIEGDWLEWWLSLVDRLGVWLLLVPAAVVVVATVWTVMTRRASVIRVDRRFVLLAAIPGVLPLLRWSQLAVFTELLGLMAGSGVPLPRALRISAASADGRDLAIDAGRLAEAIEQGRGSQWVPIAGSGIPPIVGWMVQGGMPADDLVRGLQQLSHRYEQKASARSQMMQSVFPGTALLVVGGLATLVYASAFIIPWFATLWRLGFKVG